MPATYDDSGYEIPQWMWLAGTAIIAAVILAVAVPHDAPGPDDATARPPQLPQGEHPDDQWKWERPGKGWDKPIPIPPRPQGS